MLTSSSTLGSVLLHLLGHTLIVLLLVLLESSKCIVLGGGVGVGVVHQLLNTLDNLRQRDGRSPVLLLVENRQTHGSRGVDVGVVKSSIESASWGLGGVVFGEGDEHGVCGAGPGGSVLSGDAGVPVSEIQVSVLVLGGFSKEAKRMRLSPGFPELAFAI